MTSYQEEKYIYDTNEYLEIETSILSSCRRIQIELHIEAGKIIFYNNLLADVIIRVLKDKHRWNIFQTDNLHHLKIASFIVYWIIKLKPFAYPLTSDADDKTIRISRNINEIFALFYAMQILSKKNNINTFLTKKFVDFCIYSFRYRIISSDSIILLLEFARLNNLNEKS